MGSWTLPRLSYEAAIAAHLARGLNVGFKEGYVTFDDRTLQQHCVRGFERSKEVVVFGSSTTMQIREKWLAGRSLFNHSVRRGVFEDYLALYQLHRRRGLRPALVILGIDAWVFDPGHWKSYWLTLHREYLRLAADWRIPLHRERRWRLPLDQVGRDLHSLRDRAPWYSLRALASAHIGRNPLFYPTSDDYTEDYTKRVDGSVGYHASFRTRASEEVRAIIRNSVKFPRFTASPQFQEAFEAFARGLKTEGADLALFFPPHHPEVMRLRDGNAKGEPVAGWQEYVDHLARIEEYFRAFAERTGLRVLGSFQADVAGGADDEFYDWIHPKEPLVVRLLQPLVHPASSPSAPLVATP